MRSSLSEPFPMRCLRATWLTRLLAVLLISSTGAVVLAPSAWAQRNDVAFSYGAWLWQQLRVEPNADLEAALAQAFEERPASLEDFLTTFVAAYEAKSVAALGEAFAVEAASSEALIAQLQGRYLGIVSDAVLPRISSLGIVPPSNTSNDRAGATRAVMTKRWMAWQHQVATRVAADAPLIVVPLRVLSSASPMGP